MQFLAVATALFTAGALAAPAPIPQTADCPNPAHCGTPNTNTENIDITDFTLRKNPGIQAVSFTLSGDEGTVSCSIGAVESLPSTVETCGDSQYRFGLIEGDETSEVGLRIYHQTAPFVGRTGEGPIPSYCHAGGNGPDDFVCQQVSEVTIVIQ